MLVAALLLLTSLESKDLYMNQVGKWRNLKAPLTNARAMEVAIRARTMDVDARRTKTAMATSGETRTRTQQIT